MPIAEVVIPVGLAVTLALLVVVGLAGALLAPPGWWTVPALWLASTGVSAGAYLVDQDDPDYLFLPRAALALLLCGALAVAVSRRVRPRARLWVTLPAALAGVLTPLVIAFALLVAYCYNGCLQ